MPESASEPVTVTLTAECCQPAGDVVLSSGIVLSILTVCERWSRLPAASITAVCRVWVPVPSTLATAPGVRAGDPVAPFVAQG